MIRDLELPHEWSAIHGGALAVWTSDLLAGHAGLAHAFTLGSVNMSVTGGPDREHAAACRKALCGALGLPFDRLTVARQIHGCEVVPIDPRLVGAGRESADDAVAHADGLCTSALNQPMLGLSADCPLILAFDPEAPALGLAHAGWRGTLPGIATGLIQRMAHHLGARPERMWAVIAPSAGACCFEIQEDVARLVRARSPEPSRYLRARAGRMYLDLWTANADQLAAAGVPRSHIEVAGICTICDRRFCSYRRDGKATRFAGLIASLV